MNIIALLHRSGLKLPLNRLRDKNTCCELIIIVLPLLEQFLTLQVPLHEQRHDSGKLWQFPSPPYAWCLKPGPVFLLNHSSPSISVYLLQYSSVLLPNQPRTILFTFHSPMTDHQWVSIHGVSLSELLRDFFKNIFNGNCFSLIIAGILWYGLLMSVPRGYF